MRYLQLIFQFRDLNCSLILRRARPCEYSGENDAPDRIRISSFSILAQIMKIILTVLILLLLLDWPHNIDQYVTITLKDFIIEVLK